MEYLLNKELTEIIIKLDVISKVQINQKLRFKNKNPEIMDDTYMTPIIRKISGDSREEILVDLENIHKSISDIIDKYDKIDMLNIERKLTHNEKFKIFEMIKLFYRFNTYVEKLYNTPSCGLLAIKITYNNDALFISNVAEIIESFKKVNRLIKHNIDIYVSRFKLETDYNDYIELISSDNVM